MSDSPLRPTDHRPFLAGLLLMLALLALAHLRAQPPAALPADAPENEFSAARARTVLERILGDESPHPVGTPANAAVRERVIAELRELGLEPELQEGFACGGGWGACGQVVNLIARLPGREDAKAVLVSAHYDSVPAAPGAADAGSAVAATLELARLLLAGEPLDRPVMLLINDGEEAGLLGAQVFVESAAAEEVFAVVNLEARGTTGASAMFETGSGNAATIRAFGREASRPVTNSTLYALYKLLPNDTDLTVYKAQDWPGLNFAFAEGLPRYHTPLDDLAHLDSRSLQHHGDNALAAVRALASLPDDTAGGPDAAWLDLLSLALLSWPLSWNWPLTILAALPWLGAGVLATRRRLASPAATLGAALAVLLSFVLAQAAGYGLVAGLQAVSGESAPWTAHPAWALTATIAVSALPVLLTAAWLGRRLGSWAWWLASGLWATVMAATLSQLLPGGSVLGLVPAFALNLTLLAALLLPKRWSLALFLLGAAGAALPWLALADGLRVMMGLWPPVVASAPAAFAVVLLAATAPTGRRRWLASIGALAVALLGFAGACVVEPYSETEVRHERLLHVENADMGEALWIQSGNRSEEWKAALSAESRSLSGWPQPGGEVSFEVVDAPLTGAAPPLFEILSSESTEIGRRLVARFASARGASVGMLRFPAESGLASLQIESHDRRIRGNGVEVFRIRSFPPKGASITIELEGNAPVDIVVEDQSAALPPAADALLAARPATSAPVQDGDRSILHRTVTLP